MVPTVVQRRSGTRVGYLYIPEQKKYKVGFNMGETGKTVQNMARCTPDSRCVYDGDANFHGFPR